MKKIILHIDVNSAFLSWSAIKLLQDGYKKDIRNEISVIAGDPKKRHGVVVAASIPAKKMGIKPPINLSDARKIYRNLMVVQPDYYFYKMESDKLMSYLKKLFPIVEQFSIDECFVDYTSIKKIYGDEVLFANKLKDNIYKKFGFTVNIGIGNNKLCAKMASDFEKPNKVHTLYLEEFASKMWPKDISELFMAGKKTCEKLRELGINTIKELANCDVNILTNRLKSIGKLLHDYANGIDDSIVDDTSYDRRKSIGYSKTLEQSSDNQHLLYKYLSVFSKKISSYLIDKNIYINTLVITIRDDYFKTISHQEKYLNAFNKEEQIYEYSKALFKKLWDGNKVRLIGLSATDFTSNQNYQLSLFEANNTKDDSLDKLITTLNKSLGKNVIFKCNELNKESRK